MESSRRKGRETYEGMLQKLSKRELVEATLEMLPELSEDQLGAFHCRLERSLGRDGTKKESEEKKKRQADHAFDMSKSVNPRRRASPPLGIGRDTSRSISSMMAPNTSALPPLMMERRWNPISSTL
jgi:hypothetical protein